MLDSFFNKMSSGQVDSNNYFLQDTAQSKPDGSWDHWMDDLPPMFHGSTTSLAPPVQSAFPSRGGPNELYDFNHGPTYTSGQGQALTTSPEVLAAASTLLHNGHTSRYRGPPNDYSLKAPAPNDQLQVAYRRYNAFESDPVGSYGHLSATTPDRNTPRPLLQDSNRMNEDTVLRDMFYGNNTHQSVRQVNTSKAADLRWGSDASFFDHGFVAPPNQETVEEVTKTMLNKMECLEPQTSAANTRPSSPKIQRRKRPPNEVDGDAHIPGQNGRRLGEEENVLEGSSESRPRKRRKGKVKLEMKHEGNDGQLVEAVQRHIKVRRPSSGRDSRAKLQVSLEESQTKRARSQSGEQKSGRENLTDEQKRSNHILSEQKRRNLIKQGFDDLCDLVPDLRGGGFSKSAMLTQAAGWLEDLIQGNERLRMQLADLGGGNKT